MTLVRDPVTIEDTLMRVLGELTVRHAVEVTGRTQDYLYALSHPDRRESLTVRDLELLDLAHHAMHGRGLPLYELLGRRLETAAAERFACALEVGRHAADLSRENGEALAALMEIAIGADDPQRDREALRQIEDVDRIVTRIMALLRGKLASRVPPDTS